MRQFSTVIAFVLFSSLFAQINVGSEHMPRKKAGKIAPEDLQALKRSTTLLFLRVGEEAWVDEVQKQLDEFWTISTVKVHPVQEMKTAFEELEGQPISLMTMSGYRITTDKGSFLYVYLDLAMPVTNKKGDPINIHFARVDLHLSANSLMAVVNMGDFSNKLAPFLYTEAELLNWSPGLLVNYARFINDHLKKGETKLLWDSVADESALRKVSRSTLYVTDHVAQHYAAFKGTEEERETPEKLFKGYPYKYELITREQLSEKILDNEGEPFYYLVYVKSTTNKFVSIYKSDTGELIYSDYTALSYNFKDKDVNKLAKKMK